MLRKGVVNGNGDFANENEGSEMYGNDDIDALNYRIEVYSC